MTFLYCEKNDNEEKTLLWEKYDRSPLSTKTNDLGRFLSKLKFTCPISYRLKQICMYVTQYSDQADLASYGI